MGNKLIEKCDKYIKNGKLDKFYDYILKNNLTQQFIEEVFYDSYNRGYKGEEYKKAMNISNFALKISIESLKQKYGEKLANRFIEIIYDNQHPSQKNFNLYRLINSQLKPSSETEVSQIEKILDISSNKENLVGTHIIGKEKRRGVSKRRDKFIWT